MATRARRPAPPPVEEAPEEAVVVAPAPKRQPVTRTCVAAWWCPVCDRSHTHAEDRCDGCGFIR